jgi:DNA-binding SARP family transcriptional activator
MRHLGCGVVDTSADLLQLEDGADVDVTRMVELAHQILDGGAQGAGWRAVAPLSGELLPQWDDEWVMLERERLRQLQLHALEVLSDRLTEAGRLPEAVEVAVAAVSIDLLRESSRRSLIRAYLAEGNIVEACREYAAFRERLQSELGVEPSALLQDLIVEGRRA